MSENASHHDHAASLGTAAVRNCVIADLGMVGSRVAVALLGGSAALAADSLHGLSDIATTVFLGFAFMLAGRSATSEYTYGFHRAEDLAGLLVLIFLAVSTFISGRTSLDKALAGTETTYLVAGMAVALIGLVGKVALSYYKIRVGKKIDSLSLVADGKHSRADGVSSLGAFLGLLGVYLGYPVLDPVFGLVITGAMCYITYRLGRDILSRLLDSIDEETLERIKGAALSVEGVLGIHSVRARWAGHRVFCEMHVTVSDDLNICDAHAIGDRVSAEVKEEVRSVEQCLVHLGPESCGHDGVHADDHRSGR